MKFALTLASFSLIAVTFTACGDEKKNETVVVENKVETVIEPKETVVIPAQETKKVETASAPSDGNALYKKCAGCHGADAEKPALGKSAIIAGWDSTKTVEALKGYKDGTYGGTMKGLMKGQVAGLTDADIQALAEFISTK